VISRLECVALASPPNIRNECGAPNYLTVTHVTAYLECLFAKAYLRAKTAQIFTRSANDNRQACPKPINDWQPI